MSADPVTSIDLPEDGSVHCWCCGTIDAPDRMVNLGDHPEVHLCLGCAHFVHHRAREIEGEGKQGPAAVRGGTSTTALPGWRRGDPAKSQRKRRPRETGG